MISFIRYGVIQVISEINEVSQTLTTPTRQITSQKFQVPSEGEEKLRKHFSELNEEIKKGFRDLEDSL